jgi:hypothetical protein
LSGNNENSLYSSFIVLVNTAILAQTVFFVSLEEKNSNPGTKENPFASIEYAKLQACKVQGSVVINLLDGIYYLNRPVVFTPEDSRKENETLSITNFNNQKVIVAPKLPLEFLVS